MNIKELRKKTKLKQYAFADFFEIPLSTLRNWEQGKRQCPTYLLKLVEYKLKNEKMI